MAMAGANPVARHYGSGGIAERVIAALRSGKGQDAPLTPENLAQFDHFHGRGVAATEELAAQLQPQPGERLLDIGSGIGGPARWFAAKFDDGGRSDTGILRRRQGPQRRDRACRPGRDPQGQRARLAGAQRRVRCGLFAERDHEHRRQEAVLPRGIPRPEAGRPAGIVECVRWAVRRTLFPGALGDGPRHQLSGNPGGDAVDLLAAGFEIVSFRDTTEAVREAQRRTRERLEKGELPRVAADIILGERAREMQINSLRSTEEGRSIAIEALVRKPS
jgi:hypothetical protein